ncbi:hypothetical protein [Niallia sp. 03190]|uniref:hypothetical protein n=1 Tax=Niallia sp. 03190 TaxID=3458061 RepID=UPI004045133D
MKEIKNASAAFLQTVLEQLFLKKNEVLEEIQHKVLEDLHNKSKFYLFDEEWKTIDRFANLTELWSPIPNHIPNIIGIKQWLSMNMKA